MKLRVHQVNTITKHWDSRYDEWVYPIRFGQKILQCFNEETQEWEPIPLVIEEINE